MLKGLASLVFAAAALAQENAPIGLLRGDLVSSTATEFVFHTSDGHTYSCWYDQKTYVERDSERIHIGAIAKGERIEVVTDRRQANLCYAMTVHVLEAPRSYLVPGVRPRPKAATAPKDPFPQRGDITFSGVVLRVTSDALVLRARSGEQRTIRLRPDTRFLIEGQTAQSGSLRANTVVFVRARKNLDDEVEAYQVVSGEILQPEQ